MGPDGAVETIERLCRRAFGPGAAEVGAVTDINRGRGAFSLVLRAELASVGRQDRGPDNASGQHPGRPPTVVAKLPRPGPNGAAARASGSYRRESLAYREILPRSPVGHPHCFAILDEDGGESCALLLEDLGDRRLPDQLDGLTADDALAVADALARFHRSWGGAAERLGRSVRHNTVAGLPTGQLDRGLAVLDERWSEVLGRADRAVFADLRAAHAGLAARFGVEPATLCHGDPRADNLAFAADGGPILFDWQQMAVQFGEADLAWLAATSLTVTTRRSVERALVEAGGGRLDRYRLGMALPGLAVLLLAQRELPDERARRFVATSLQRIAAAVADNETARLA